MSARLPAPTLEGLLPWVSRETLIAWIKHYLPGLGAPDWMRLLVIEEIQTRQRHRIDLLCEQSRALSEAQVQLQQGKHEEYLEQLRRSDRLDTQIRWAKKTELVAQQLLEQCQEEVDHG